MSKTQEYLIVREFIPDKIEYDTILNIFSNNVTAYTHGLHKYPAKFIPHIPKWAINKYLVGKEEKTILDPFCGSGTTLVEGMLSGNNVIGIDIDPLSCLIAKVKTTVVNPSELNKVSNWLVREIKKATRGEFKPECETIEHWFPKDTINKLSIIRTLIDQIPEKFGDSKSIKDIQDILFICFSSIIRRVSYADNESQKTYVSHTHIKTPEEPFSLFFAQIDLFIERIIKLSETVKNNLKSQIICSSSVESLKTKLKEQKIDLVITSPPYIKAIDYIYNQMVELFWIGDLFGIQTQSKQNEKKKEYIGTKHFHKKDFIEYTPFETIVGISELDKKIQEVFKTDKKNGHKHAYITFKYFNDIEAHFIEMSKCLDEGVHYIMVIGDSSVSNIFFNTSNFIIEIAERNGFKITNKWGYKIKNRYMRFDRNGRGGIIDIDWVLDFIKL